MAGIHTIERETLSPWTPAMLESELKISYGRQFVALSATGELIGWCCSRLLDPEAELLKIAVSLKMRGAGVGSLLLDNLQAQLKSNKISTLFLEVRASNHVALKFYKKYGFVNVGSRPGYYAKPMDDALILRKEL